MECGGTQSGGDQQGNFGELGLGIQYVLELSGGVGWCTGWRTRFPQVSGGFRGGEDEVGVGGFERRKQEIRTVTHFLQGPSPSGFKVRKGPHCIE